METVMTNDDMHMILWPESAVFFKMLCVTHTSMYQIAHYGIVMMLQLAQNIKKLK